MSPADLIPASALPAVSWLVARRPRGRTVAPNRDRAESQWRQIALRYPKLGANPAKRIERARRRIWFLSGRALSSPRHASRWEAGRPDPAPTVYLTAHLGDLRAMRYALRLEGVPAAVVISPATFGKTGSARSDARCDRRCFFDFPHLISSENPHRLRTALRRGSIIITIDGPEFEFVETAFLGGVLRLDPRPLRLARLAGVPARAVFVTAPGGRLTVTLGRKIDPGSDPTAALREVGLLLDAVASRSPCDFDGLAHWRNRS